MIRRPPRSTQSRSSAASDVYKRQGENGPDLVEADVMKRRVIAFDLDGTLAVTKSTITDVMADRLGDLLSMYEVCVISGGKFDQFEVQVIDRLDVSPKQMARLHIMPTSGTRYLRFDDRSLEWVIQYSEDLSAEAKARVIEVLTAAAKEMGYWETDPYGEIIEDRGSQITFSALCLLYTSPSPRDGLLSRMPSSA